jgi:hypothetical protein
MGMAAPLVLLYVLRIRRRRFPAPTLLFWEEVFQDSKPRAWWQRLRSLLSLLVQLLLLALLAAAVSDPLSAGQTRERRLWVLLVDRSASMAMPAGTDPQGPSRLDEARRAALDVVKGMREWDQATLIGFATDADVLCGRTDNPRRLAAAIRDIRQSHLPSRPAAALRLAASLQRDAFQPEILVFSDQAEPAAPDGGLPVRWHRIGGRADNVGITHLAARPADEQRDLHRILLKVMNGGNAPREIPITLRAEGQVIDSVYFALAPGEEKSSVVEHAFPAGAVLEAVRAGEPDALAADDHAWLVIPAPTPLEVALVEPEPNLFLEQVLEAQALVDWIRISAEEAAARTNLDLVVYHRTVADPPPHAHAFYVHPAQTSKWWSLGEPITNALVDAADESSPLLRHLHFDDVLIRRAIPIIPNEAGEPILWSLGEPLAAVWRADGRHVAALGIDLTQSDLPLRTAFPILMANLMRWVRPDGDAEPHSLKTGDVLTFDADAPNGFVVAPDGTRTPWTARNGSATIGPLDQVGLHALINTAGAPIHHPIAVNLADRKETAAGYRPATDDTGADTPPLPTAIAGGSPIWWWLAATALALGLTEWWLHQRRWLE